MGSARVAGRRGVVATSHPLAVAAGIDALDAGGTAVDAAGAASAVLCVVDPRSTGIGGDLFCQIWQAGAPGPVALEAAGPAPAGMTVDALRDAGHDDMPTAGPWTITVPGAVAGWAALLERFGNLPMRDVLAPAVRHAREGFRVTRWIAEEWADTAAKLRDDDEARATFLPDGRSPAAGKAFRNPGLGRVLADIGEHGPDAFYRGDVASRIGSAVERAGGPLRAEDLSAWEGPRWVEPVRRPFRGVDVYELPPPGQGLIVLEALGIYEGIDARSAEDRAHASIESIKLAFADALAYVADPMCSPVPVDRLLSVPYLDARRAEVRMDRAIPAEAGKVTDTVYVAATDGEGNACSLIQSLYEGFGSGVGVPGTGIVLQNRGAGFILDDTHPNRPEPGKRPYHTIIPAMLGRDGGFAGALGVVGGFQQPQGQLQILRHLLEDAADPQAAVDAPRFRSVGGNRLALEPSFDPDIARALRDRGHEIQELRRFEAGGAQLILREGDLDVGASDPRKDGAAVAR